MAVIEVADLSYTYPTGQRPALKNLTFQIEAGQLVALLGANDAGKSSLCLALAGFIPQLYHGEMQGAVSILGADTRQHAPAHFAGQVGLVLQNPANQLSGMRYTVFEEVAFGLENLGVAPNAMPARIRRALKLAGLEGLDDRSPYTLSGGQQQRLALASVLTLEPSVLILDEPTAMLDPQGSQEVFAVVQQLSRSGVTVIIAEHRLEWVAQYADRVIALARGEMLLDGTPQAVLSSPALIPAGIGWTRYTHAARLGQERNLWPAHLRLPVTLQQATSGFVRTHEHPDADPH